MTRQEQYFTRLIVTLERGSEIQRIVVRQLPHDPPVRIGESGRQYGMTGWKVVATAPWD